MIFVKILILRVVKFIKRGKMKRNLLNSAIVIFITSILCFLLQTTTYGLEPYNLPAYNVKDFRVVGDGKTMNTNGIQLAIDKAAQDGGGVVYFPPGSYVTGTILIGNNVTLYLEAGATISGSVHKEDYEYGCLIYSENAVNIAIRGRGTIDGNGESFWKREKGRWVTGDWRPNRIMKFVKCDNLLLEDITIQNSPAWTVHPVDCNRVTIRGISILNGIYEDDGPNTDGINPDGCKNVRISDCYLQCGDNAITFKITDRPNGNRICRDITVTNCIINSDRIAIKLGSETHGEFRNITVSNCTIIDGAGGIGIQMRDGGLLDGFLVNNVSMTLKDGGQPIYIWSHRRTDETPFGTVRNVIISNITAVSDGCIFLTGPREKYMEGITLENITLFMSGGREKEWNDDPPYPFPVFGPQNSPYDIFCRYVNDLKIRNVQITWNSPEKKEWGSAIRCFHVNELEIDGFIGRQSLNSNAPAIWLKDVKKAFIHNCRAPKGTNSFLKVDEGTEHVTLMGNDFSQAKKMFTVESGIDLREVFETGNRKPNGC